MISSLLRRLLLMLLATILGLTTSCAQEHSATLHFLGNGDGLSVYLDSETPVFKGTLTRPSGTWQEAKVHAAVIDFWGKTATEVDMETKADGGTLSFEGSAPGLKLGWYYLDFSISDMDGTWTVARDFDPQVVHSDFPQFIPPMFAVVPTPGPQEERQRSPLGVDTGVTTSFRSLSTEVQIEMAGRLGVSWARDRIPWEKVEPSEGKFDWGEETGSTSMGARARKDMEDFRQRGLHVLQLFHGTPAWAAPEGAPTFSSLPDDLRSLYGWTKEAATTLSKVDAWEVWNEEDIDHFCSEPPDQFAAAVKVASLGIRDAPTHPLVLPGPYARDPRVGDYAETLAANGIRPYVDDYSFHTYAPSEGGVLHQVLETNISLATKQGFGKGQIWITESGAGFTKAAPPSSQEGREGQVHYLLSAYPEILLTGARPLFWFYLHPGPEEKQWGLTNANLEPFPVYAALAVMAHTLGEGVPLGKFSLGTTTVSLFQDGATEVAIASPATGSHGVVNLGNLPAAAQCLDVMGAPLTMTMNDADEITVDSSGWPFYVRGAAWNSRVTAPAAFFPATPEKLPPPSRIVIRARYPRDLIATDSGQPIKNFDWLASKWAPRGYRIAADGSINASVEVYNFSSQPVSGTVSAQLPKGYTATPAQQNFSVEPGGRQVLAFPIVANNPSPGDKLSFIAQDPAGSELDRSVSLWNAEIKAP